ncbi:NADH:ubiquinone reductase (Na(+)-transporting) subunit F [Mycobacterium nebraskense]|uniref:NADH:ubiquinone reductase (Na(+)-transporting) subunit F n=1 Tax=Mycobacterium nebraskense TaxID=244292 RepID=UPI0023F42C1B|nr:2Fe-2S iron-sulfur cluster binding domain-containing protein [Mycobacterium nebraskense]MBI2693002.1 2Fe-2S iron-sulfur cluster binding domain-containing protein [Mycobacterium nebraskense]
MTETYTIRVEPLGREVQCRTDQNILDACLRQGVWLPHACTHGTCATCKVQVLEGDVEHNDASSFALMDYERTEGKALICVATPESDVTIEADVDAEEGVEFHPIRDYTGTVTAIEDCARGTRRLLIDLDAEITFNPGQYVQVAIPGKDVNRSWSMANPPGQPDRVELQIRNTPGGLATEGWVFNNLAVGDNVQLTGPYGRFFLREARNEPAILIGGGTGLAPLKAIVRHVLETGLPHSLHLYQGARTEADLYDVEFFRDLAEQFPKQFTYRPCLSDEEVDGFAHGMVTDVVASDFDTCRGHVAYLCGPPPMVEAAIKTLMKKRLFPRDIYREDFFDSSDKATGGIRSPLMKTT